MSIKSQIVNFFKKLLAYTRKTLYKGPTKHQILEDTEAVMAVPKRKTSKSKRNMRRSHDAIQAPAYREDKSTGEMTRPHHVCLKTGMYGGRQVLQTSEQAA